MIRRQYTTANINGTTWTVLETASQARKRRDRAHRRAWAVVVIAGLLGVAGVVWVANFMFGGS